KRFKNVARDSEGALASFESLAESIVFDFDADRAVVANLQKRADEFGPIDLAKARNARQMIFLWMRENADANEFVAKNLDILGVDVEELLAEISQGREPIHLLPDHVRGVVIEAEI